VDTSVWQQLTDLLTTECSVLRELVAAAERQKQALLLRDQQGVEAATKEQEALLAELHRCEAERLALVAGGLAREGSAPHAVTLQALVEAAPEAKRARLAALRDDARSLVRQLSTLTETNAQLLRQELAFIDLYMSILSPDAGIDAYHDPARARRPAGGAPVAFDTRA